MDEPMKGGGGLRWPATIAAFVLVFWLPFVYAHLYFLGFACMDTWVMTGPAALAKAPFAIVTPLLGSFDGADRAWGLHWPGGPLVTSIITPFLPHQPATFVAISLFYWMLESLATAALVRRLTGSAWMALCGFFLVAGDRWCFSDTWLQRYENLSNAIAIAGILALCASRERPSPARFAVAAGSFFLLPLMQPIFSGLGLGWVIYLGLRTLLTRQPWRQFSVAAGGYAAGWGAFLAYYWSRPWLYAIFLNHYRLNVQMSETNTPPSVGLLMRRLAFIDYPVEAGTVIYFAGFAAIAWLAYGMWKAGRGWREFLLREDLAILATLGLVATLLLVQRTSNLVYWACPWAFAAAVACDLFYRLREALPARRRLVTEGVIVLLLLHCAFVPARTYMWYKTGFVNLRAKIREFAATLPQKGHLFVPDVLWDTYADGHRPDVFMNSLPYYAGLPTQTRYASYIGSMLRPGDVLVLDVYQSHPTLSMDPSRQPGWKVIGACKVVYSGPGGSHGFDLTAYQKQ